MQNDEGVNVDLYIPRKWYVRPINCQSLARRGTFFPRAQVCSSLGPALAAQH